MAAFSVARLEEIPEIDNGQCPFRPVRLHFGIMTFGVNAMTARSDGDRLINEHEETEPDSSEELYVVVSGHARVELDGPSRCGPPLGGRRGASASRLSVCVTKAGSFRLPRFGTGAR